jgi:hypothetical protein
MPVEQLGPRRPFRSHHGMPVRRSESTAARRARRCTTPDSDVALMDRPGQRRLQRSIQNMPHGPARHAGCRSAVLRERPHGSQAAPWASHDSRLRFARRLREPAQPSRPGVRSTCGLNSSTDEPRCFDTVLDAAGWKRPREAVAVPAEAGVLAGTTVAALGRARPAAPTTAGVRPWPGSSPPSLYEEIDAGRSHKLLQSSLGRSSWSGE